MRLHQICCGFLTTDEGDIVALKNNRLDELLDIVDETQGKVIIWATWTHDIEKITEAPAPPVRPRVGGTLLRCDPGRKSAGAVRDFQDPDHPYASSSRTRQALTA
jgi:hypothetical protein